MSKERFQNPVVGDELKLRVFAYNSNNYRNFNSVTKVEYTLLMTKKQQRIQMAKG